MSGKWSKTERSGARSAERGARSSAQKYKVESRWREFLCSRDPGDLHAFFNHVDRYGDSCRLRYWVKQIRMAMTTSDDSIAECFHFSNPHHLFVRDTWWCKIDDEWVRDERKMHLLGSITKWKKEVLKRGLEELKRECVERHGHSFKMPKRTLRILWRCRR